MTTIALHDYIRKIEQFLEEGHFPEAENHCRHILAHYPRHLDTYRVLAKALLEQHRYEDAADLFQRVLSADPNDLVAHVGLADIYRHESLLDQSLWHLERAFELEPYNHIIQDEIRQLYVKHNNLARDVAPSATRDVVGDVVLDRVPLNQAALAHIYLKGELYREAINEVRQVLAMQPPVAQSFEDSGQVAEDRVDLEIVLAEALWRDEQRIDAAEVCQHILQQLPSCVMANAILGDILLQTGRADEARPYLKRVQALTQVDSNHLDLETSVSDVVAHAFSQEGAPPLPQAVTIELLEITPDEVAPATSPSPMPTADWVKEVVQPSVADGAAEQPMDEAPDAEHEYDWLAGVVDMQSFEDSGQVADALPIEDADEVWQPEAEEKVDTDWFADSSILEETETADGQPEDGQSEIGALPDWLAELNEAAEPALSAAEVSAELDFDDVTDLSGEGESMEPADLDDFEPDTSEIPTWLRGQATTDEPVHSDIPDWLSKDVGDGDVASETAPGEEAAVPPEMPGWLTDVTSVDDLEPVEADPRLASDWFADLEEEEADLQAESAASTATPSSPMQSFEDSGQVADDEWLAELASSTAELDDTIGEEALTETDDMQPPVAEPEVADDWLAALERDTGELPEQPAAMQSFEDSGPVADEEAAAEFFDWMPEEAGEADYGDEVAEWLLGGDLAEQTEWEEGVMGDMQPELPKKDSDQQDGPEPEEAADMQSFEDSGQVADDDLEWLEALTSSATSSSATSSSHTPEPSVMDELTGEELPDWLSDLSSTAGAGEGADDMQPEVAQPEVAQPEETTLDDVDYDIPDWLRTSPLDSSLLETGGIAEAEEAESAEADVQPEVGQSFEDSGQVADELSYSDGTVASEEAPVDEPPSPESIAPTEDDTELSDWLSELEREGSPDESGEGLDWLDQLASGQPEPIEQMPTLEWPDESEEDETSLDWLSELAAAPDDTLVTLGLTPADADQSGDTSEEDTVVDVPEDLDDAMAWLEELAARQGAPVEELPSIANVLESGVGDEADVQPEVVQSFEDSGQVADEEERVGAELELEAMAFEVEEEEVVVEEPDVLLPEPDEELEEAMVDLDEAMAWLEDLMAEQDTSLEEANLQAPESAEMTVAEEDEATMIWPPPRAEREAQLTSADDLLEEALDWLEQMVLEDGPLPELEDISVDATEEELEEALDWLEKVATGEAQPPAVDVEAARSEVELEVGEVLYEEEEEVVYNLRLSTAESDIMPIEREEDFLATLSPMPDDPEEALAWLEQLAAEAGAEAEEEVPAEEAEATDEAPAPMELPESLITDSGAEGEEAVEEGEEAVEPELDFLADMPDDPDEAMAWLEKLAARQGAPLEELPSIDADEAEEILTPEWMAAEVEMEAAEPEEAPSDVQGPPEAVDEVEPETELELAETEVEALEAGEAVAEEAESPEALPDVDISGWLEAEAEATTMGVEETAPLAETGPLPAPVPERPVEPDYELELDITQPPLAQPEVADEELILAETEPVVSALALDEAQLAQARQALAARHYDDAMESYQSLVTMGEGLITLIGDLEAAVDQHPQQPLLRRLLGDAYMRNGQLQKALETYRETLDQL